MDKLTQRWISWGDYGLGELKRYSFKPRLDLTPMLRCIIQYFIACNHRRLSKQKQSYLSPKLSQKISYPKYNSQYISQSHIILQNTVQLTLTITKESLFYQSAASAGHFHSHRDSRQPAENIIEDIKVIIHIQKMSFCFRNWGFVSVS